MFKSLIIKGNYINGLCDSTEGVLPYLQLFFRADVKICRPDDCCGLFSAWFGVVQCIAWIKCLEESPRSWFSLPCFSSENMVKSLFRRYEHCRSSCTPFLLSAEAIQKLFFEFSLNSDNKAKPLWMFLQNLAFLIQKLDAHSDSTELLLVTWSFFCKLVIFYLFQGLRNDLKAALDKIDQQYLNEIVGGQEAGDDDSQNDLKVHEENTTIEELEVCDG